MSSKCAQSAGDRDTFHLRCDINQLSYNSDHGIFNIKLPKANIIKLCVNDALKSFELAQYYAFYVDGSKERHFQKDDGLRLEKDFFIDSNKCK